MDMPELAERSGVALERLRAFVDLGTLQEGPEGFRPPDIQLARMLEAFDRAGIAPEQIGTLMADGRWSNAWADLIFPNPYSYSTRTLAELTGDLGLSEPFVERLYAVWQLPRPAWDEHVRDDEAELMQIASMMFEGVGRSEEGGIAGARIFSENLRRLAESQVRFFRRYVEEPLYATGMPMRESIEIVAPVGKVFIEAANRASELLHARHIEHYTMEDVILNLELSMEQAGMAPARSSHPPALAFLDLSGYTGLTEREGDEAAAHLAENLAEMVQAAAMRRGGNVVKLLGDGVMFHFRDPRGAIACGLDLVDEAPARGLPRARMGVHAGQVIFRDGDYFGRTVNVAARVTDYARPGEVLATTDALEAGTPDGVALTEIGEVALKGLAQPVSLVQARRG